MREAFKNYKILEDNNKALCKQVKELTLRERELKLLLDMYKSIGKEGRDKAEIMASEKKIRSELEECRVLLVKLQENRREEKRNWRMKRLCEKLIF